MIDYIHEYMKARFFSEINFTRNFIMTYRMNCIIFLLLFIILVEKDLNFINSNNTNCVAQKKKKICKMIVQIYIIAILIIIFIEREFRSFRSKFRGT